jgi:hypothetical protein
MTNATDGMTHSVRRRAAAIALTTVSPNPSPSLVRPLRGVSAIRF